MFYQEMTLQEIQFELPSHQHELAGYPGIHQGQPLSVILDAGVLLPDEGTSAWYSVTSNALPERFVRTGPGMYAFCGKIIEADLSREGEGMESIESAVLLVECAGVPIRVTCAAHIDGTLPFGTWETRTLSGHAALTGILEDDFASGIGETLGMTAWHFERLVLTPGDPHFGAWVETDTLLPQPWKHDRILMTAKMHRRVI